MAETTTVQQFTERLQAGHRVIPVMRELFADAETPVGLYRKLAAGRPGTFLLESAEQGGIWSRWSFVGVSSFGMLLQHSDGNQWIDWGLDAERALGQAITRPALDALAALYERWRTPSVPGHPPLTGGLVGFIGWDAVRQLERIPETGKPGVDVPIQAMVFVSELIALDHRNGTVTLIATALADDGASRTSAQELWSAAQTRLDRLQDALAVATAHDLSTIDLTVEPDPIPVAPAEDFKSAVGKAKDYIRDGDVFQVVLSQRFDLPVSASALDVYRVLRALNPSPYMYLLSLCTQSGEHFSVVGSSPEALVKVMGKRVTMHPIAGSRPRGTNPEADAFFAEELLADPKEGAEHLMLVDLARNDLSRVCEAGTVAVSEFMQVERFSHIMHLVSTVEGTLLDASTPIDVLRSTFPAGTLSGAPKPRALEIIEVMEPVKRGIYGGVVGYFDFAGDADLAIAIRTATIARGTAHVQAGAGLVADSDPDSEQQETVNKAAAPLRAVAIANALGRI